MFLLMSAPLSAAQLATEAAAIEDATLAVAGWEKKAEGLWERRLSDGTEQRLATGQGRLALVPGLRAEVARLLAEYRESKDPRLAESLSFLMTELAGILGAGPAEMSLHKLAPPPACTPSQIFHGAYANATAPPGWHSIIVNAVSYWDGAGIPCRGHAYTRGSYNLVTQTGLTYNDFQACAIDDNNAGSCETYLQDPFAGPYIACNVSAYAYLSLRNGTYVLEQSKTIGSCFG